MDSHELMKLLIPDKSVKSISEFTGLTQSLLYMERRRSGDDLLATGTRNTIDRLDLFCEWNLDRNAEVVRMVGDRYLHMHQRHVNPIGEISIIDLLAQIGKAANECGEAVEALSGRSSLRNCSVEVAQAKAALERGLAMVTALEEKENN